MPPKKKGSGAKAAMGGGGAGAGKKKQQGAVVKREASVSSSSGTSSSSGKVPDELMCGICHDLLENAHQTPCCGGLSCRECIEDVAARTNQCPYCRAEPLSGRKLHTDVRIERAASCFVRPCKFDGCDYRGKRDELKVHVAACDKRPKDEALAELRAAEMKWRRQRCWQVSSIVHQIDDWSDKISSDLELLHCRLHFVDCTDAPSQVLVHESILQPPCSTAMDLLPRTWFEVKLADGFDPVIRLSHVTDQPEPTTCYIVKVGNPDSARRIVIPAAVAEAIVIENFLDDTVTHYTYVAVYLAATLGGLGLTDTKEYAIDSFNEDSSSDRY